MRDGVDVIVAPPGAEEYLERFPQFEIKSRVFSLSLNRERKCVLLIYGKRNVSLPRIDMDTEKYNMLYDQLYANKREGQTSETLSHAMNL